MKKHPLIKWLLDIAEKKFISSFLLFPFLQNCFAVNNNTAFNFYIVSSIPQISNSNLMIHLLSSVKTSLQFIFSNEVGSVVKKKIMQPEAGNNSASFDISNLAAGIYILRVVDAKGNSETKRFIK
jgi:hypothetical protein